MLSNCVSAFGGVQMRAHKLADLFSCVDGAELGMVKVHKGRARSPLRAVECASAIARRGLRALPNSSWVISFHFYRGQPQFFRGELVSKLVEINIVVAPFQLPALKVDVVRTHSS